MRTSPAPWPCIVEFVDLRGRGSVDLLDVINNAGSNGLELIEETALREAAGRDASRVVTSAGQDMHRDRAVAKRAYSWSE